jgi:hypothetical protein
LSVINNPKVYFNNLFNLSCTLLLEGVVFVFFLGLGFELGASHWLGRCSSS